MLNFTRCIVHFSKRLFSVIIFFIAGVIGAQGQQPAFPGAEGAGMYTTGGRGTSTTPTTVFEVTNLNDDNNPGSLRYALTASATYRTIVFRVSGTIHLNSKLNIRDNVTIAGQTAPGDGICIADHPVVISGNNVIVRYIRFRMGDKNQNKGLVDGSGSDDTFGGLGVSNVIIDHCSVSWSADECLTIYRGDNLTIQWSFITEPLNYSYHFESGDTDYQQHGYGGIQGAKRGTIHHNLIANCRNRNPRFAGISTYTPNTVGVENVDFRNNVIYNWGINTVYGGEGGNYNVENNYYKWGPNTSSGVKYRICNPGFTATEPYGKWYVNGNYVDGSTTNTNNNWSGVVMQSNVAADTVLSKVTTPFNLGYPVTTQSATDAYESVLQNAGAILPRRDTLDQRIVNDVRNRTGRIIDVQGGYPHGTAYALTVNAWPTLNSTTATADTDHDGMPDAWETSHSLNPNDASDRNAYDASGYTMLENYLNGVTNIEPAIAVGGSLRSFSQTNSTPSATQTFTVAGYNLTGTVTVTPPAAYDLSLDGATWYGTANPLVLTPVSGTLSSTAVMVRLNASAQGTYAGNITLVSSGAANVNVAVTGIYTTVANGLGSSIDMDGGFEKQSVGPYTGLASNTAPTSTTQWSTSAAFNIATPDARTGSKYYHYNQASASNKYAYTPILTTTPLSASTPYIIQFWYRVPSALSSTTTLSGWLTTTGANGGAGVISSATASLSSTTPVGTWILFTCNVTSSSSTPANTYAGFKIANPQPPYFDIDDFVVYPGSAADATAPDAPTAPAATGSANDNTITVSWAAPSTGVDGGGYVVVRSTSATAPVPNANGVYIAGNEMGAGYKVVYLGTNTSFTDADTLLTADTRYYYYIFTADKAYNYCAAPASVNIMIDETGTPAPAISATGTLSAFTQTKGSPSSVQTFTVSGAGLSGDITITPVTNFEISVNNGTTWSTSAVTLTPANGTVSGTTVSVRLNAAATGTWSGNIVISSTGATSINMAVSGTTVNAGTPPPSGTKLVVAKDGSGDYTGIQAAINAVPTGQTSPYKIFVRKGKYVEPVIIPSNKPYIQIVGESLAETILSYDNYSGKANPAGGTYGTSTSGTLIVNAADVMIMNLSIENATGYGINANAAVPAPGDGPQAVAVYTTSDRVVFYNCRFNSGQDTYYGGNNKATRCYFKNCYIDGNTDFLFGSSTIIFDTCIIYPRTRLDNGSGGFVTAVNTKAESLYGYVFRDCKITKNRGVTFYTLGRPWQNDAGTADAAKSRNKTVFLNTIMGSSVKSEGWSAWDAGTNTGYITYGEYNSRKYDGTPVDVSGRVSWSKQLTAAEAVKYYNNDTVFINANTPAMTNWNPYAVWPELSATFTPELSVSNLIAKKGNTTSTITWNLSWPMPGVTCDLYRSNDKVNFSKISSQVSTEDTACNFSFIENIPPPGQTYYYIVRASKTNYTSITSDTTSVVSTPTITVSGSMGSFLQGLGTPSSTQTFVVSGANLMDNITVMPPAPYEVSTDNTNWYNSTTPLIITQSNGVVANTYVSVRLNGTQAGTYNGNIVNASTNAANVNVAVSGTIQTDPLSAGAIVLEQWPLTTNNADSAAVRAVGVTGTTPTFKGLTLSDGVTVAAIPPYSALRGQAYGATADGFWTTAKGGPGGTLNRSIYQQFTVVAASTHTLKVDSIILSNAFYNTSSNTKLAVVYSTTNFRTDSTEIKVAAKNGTGLTPGTSGTFTGAFDVSNQTAGVTDVFALLLNGSSGVTVKAGDTLAFRIYNCTGTTSAGRYAQLKNVIVKGSAVKNPVAGDYRSVKSGEWSDTATWRKYDGTNWVPGSATTDYPAYDNGVNTATIQNGHTVSYTTSFSKGFGYIQKTVIASGGQLVVAAGQNLKVAGIDGTQIVLQVDGTLTNLGTIGTNSKVVYQINGKFVNSGTLGFNTSDSVAVSATGTWQHDMNGGLPSRISFASGSTLLVTGIKTAQTNLFTTPTTVSNIVWNCTAQQNYFALRNTLAAVTGNFTVQSTGTTYIALSQSTATFRIGGNYIQTGGSVFFNESASGIIDSMVVAGDFKVTGGAFGANMKNTDPLYIKLNGSNKTFSHIGNLTNTNILVNGYYTLGANLTVPTAGFGLVVNGTLITGTNVVSGSGTTTISDGATVSFGAATGIDGNFANTGAKQYSTNANYTFNGSVAQTTGATLPAGVHTLTINNSNNVGLSASLTAGIVNLTSGKLLLGNNSLTDTTIIGNVPANYIVTNGTGALKQALNSTLGNVLFPVGSSVSSYTPATILANSVTANNFSVSVKDTSDYGISDTTSIVKKQWTITSENASATINADVTLGWLTGDQGIAFATANASLYNYQNNTWLPITTTTAGSGTLAAPYTATGANLTNVGVFVISSVPLTPGVTTTGTPGSFAQTIGTPSAVQTYTASGSNLVSDITVTPPAGYEVSVNGTNWYTSASPLVLTQSKGTVPTTTIRVRLNSVTPGTFTGSVIHTATGVTTQSVPVTGTAVLPPVITVTGSLDKFMQTTGAPSAVKTYTLTAAHLTEDVTITPPAGFEVSADGATWYNSNAALVVARNIDTIVPTTISVRLNTLAAGTYAGNITHVSSGAVTANVAVTGQTLDPVVTTFVNTLRSFSQTVGKPSDVQTAVLTITNVPGAVTITSPAGYEVSADTGKTWITATSQYSLATTLGATVKRNLMIRLNAKSAGAFDGNIVVQVNGTTVVNAAVTGIAYTEYTLNPNPARDYVTIYHPKLYTVRFFRLYNANGVFIGTYQTKSNTGSTTVYVNGLQNGMYFVEFTRLNERVLLRFIKQ